MSQLTREKLYSLEDYAVCRDQFRAKVMEHKKLRRLPLGDHAALYFEDELTMQYQVQEMLRIEKIFEADGIQEELDVYNPLIPDGQNLKATFMIEFADINERKAALAKMIGIENQLYIQVAEFEKVYAIANEDLDRSSDEKTSSVHFVRFELSPEMISAAKQGASILAGTEHDAYRVETRIEGEIRRSLVGDLH
ncbi:MAG: DUF3501 family protein [Neptuniibacter sp.]